MRLTFAALALTVAVDFISALPIYAQEPSEQWQSLVAAARTAAKEIAAGKAGPDVLSPLNNAQRELPPDQPRPTDCWGMMVDAYSQRSLNPSYGIKRAHEAANCYREKALAGTSAPTVEQPPRSFNTEPRGSSLPLPAGCTGKVLEHGEGEIANFPTPNNWDVGLKKNQRYQNINICADASIIGTRDLSQTGTLISFWAIDSGNLYFAEIDGDGSFGWGLVENKHLSTTNKLKATAFNPGINKWNHLELDLRGNRATLFINGRYEGYVTGEPPKVGFVGLGGRTPRESGATLSFRDFTISQ